MPMSRDITKWSWGESNPRPLGGYRTRYDHSCTAASMATALAGQRTSQGGHHQVFPRCQCSFTRSVVFPYGPSTLLLPGCMDQAPCAVTGHDDSLQPGLNQAARANCSLAVHFVPPFNESVATRVANSTSRSQRRNQSAPLHCCTAVFLYCGIAVLLHRYITLCLTSLLAALTEYRVGRTVGHCFISTAEV